MNKRILLGALLALVGTFASAEIQPERINFQGKLINPATNNPQTGNVTLTFNLYNVPTGGASLYTEQQTVTLTNGVFSVEIGTINALSRELFIGASAYLGVTVQGDAGGEMVPRQSLVMSAYAFSANQLSDNTEVRLIAGTIYSTFTSAGNLVVPAGVSGSSGTFVNGITASSGTFTAKGATQFSLTTSSGINMGAGILDVTGTSGILATDTGITLSTIDFTGEATDPGSANAGYMYYNTSTGSIKVYDGSSSWAYVFGQSLSRKSFFTTSNTTTAIAVNKSAAAAIIFNQFYLPGPMMVDFLQCVVTTALGATGDIGIYNAAGTLVLNGGSGSLSTAAALKTVAPTQTGTARFLPPGQYYAAVTFNSATGRLAGDTITSGAITGVGSIATGGGSVLPATIVPANIVASTVMFYFEMHP